VEGQVQYRGFEVPQMLLLGFKTTIPKPDPQGKDIIQ